MSFLPGQEYGNGLADLLYGDVNPSGKLPLTIPNRNNEQNFTIAQYPGVKLNDDDFKSANYSEGLFVG